MTLTELSNQVSDWVNFTLTVASLSALLVGVVVVGLVVLEEGITWPWQARRIAVWSGAVDRYFRALREQRARQLTEAQAGLADVVEIEPARTMRLTAPVEDAELVEHD